MREYEKMLFEKKESERLNSKIIEYERKSKKGELNLKIIFERDISKINLKELRTSEIHIINLTEYAIVDLNIDKVVSKIREDFDKFYSKQDLSVMKEFIDTARLIEHIEAGKAVFPPIIEPIRENIVAVRDGNHRIGLLRFLNYSQAPFLIKNNLVNDIDYLK